MNTKILDNGNKIIVDKKTPKEIANRLGNTFDDNKCLVCECDDGTPSEVAEKITNKHDNESKIKIDKTLDNGCDELNKIKKVNIKDMVNNLCESRKNKLPKHDVDLI